MHPGDVTFRYWRPQVAGRSAILVGFLEGQASGFCHDYMLLGRIEMPTANHERGLPIPRCTLDSNLAAEWSQILRATGPWRGAARRESGLTGRCNCIRRRVLNPVAPSAAGSKS
jgi:hypothetical protein